MISGWLDRARIRLGTREQSSGQGTPAKTLAGGFVPHLNAKGFVTAASNPRANERGTKPPPAKLECDWQLPRKPDNHQDDGRENENDAYCPREPPDGFIERIYFAAPRFQPAEDPGRIQNCPQTQCEERSA